MKSLSKDTLAYQLGMRPAVQYRDMTAIPVSQVVTALNAMMGMCDLYAFIGGTATVETGDKVRGSPERDALSFYLLNHSVSIIRQRVHVYAPLGKYLPLVERYHSELAVRSARMFFYLLLICTRESRHEKNSEDMTDVYAKHGAWTKTFIQSIKGMSSLSAAERFRQHPPTGTMGAYTEFLADCFNTGSFSGGYGGPAWGKIAEVLRDFVKGKLTAEMMEDTAFTLCHNNGPIFNKGMLFDLHTSEIYKILDVQRSGQIPQLVVESGCAAAKDPWIQTLLSECKAVVGDAFSSYVDWYAVEELGAVKTYPDEKKQQVKVHGHPTKFKAKMEAEAVKVEISAKVKLAELQSKVEVFPGQFITKITRAAL